MSIQRATINLDGPELTEDHINGKRIGWWSDGTTLTVRSQIGKVVYRLPTGRPVVSVMRLGEGRAHLKIGGFKSTTVVVNGPVAVINDLAERVL